MSTIALRPLPATRQAYSPSVQFTTEEPSPSPVRRDASGLEGDEDYDELRRGFFENRDGRDDDNGNRIHAEWRRQLWYLLEAPSSSSSSVAVHIASTGLICTSALITILETLPAFHATPSHVWFGLETTLVVCFTVEYVARFIAHSESWRSLFLWARSFFAIVDLLAILPYYIEIALQADTTAFFRFSILRTFRLLRVFRPFRNSNTILLTIEVMYLSMKRSKDALFALGFFVAMLVIVFSTLLYFAERGIWDEALQTFVIDGEPSQFDSIPAAAWFVLVTITTVGYGQTVPHSTLGRIVTLPLLLFGLLLIALPSFVLGREFAVVWEALGGHRGMNRPGRSRSNSRTAEFQLLETSERPTSSENIDLEDIRRPAPSDPLAIPRRQPRSRPSQDNFSSSSSSLRARDLTNHKLALNQQVLSAQIDKLTLVVERLQNELRVVKGDSMRKSIDES